MAPNYLQMSPALNYCVLYEYRKQALYSVTEFDRAANSFSLFSIREKRPILLSVFESDMLVEILGSTVAGTDRVWALNILQVANRLGFTHAQVVAELPTAIQMYHEEFLKLEPKPAPFAGAQRVGQRW